MENGYTLITGASSGMGASCARQLSQDRKLILASENLDMLASVREQCTHSEQHLLWHCNFATEREDIYNSLNGLLSENGIVVNAYIHFAGLTRLLPVKNFTIPHVDKIFNVNFFSIIEILRALLRKSNDKALSSIVLISALASARGNVGNSVYAASKGAINSLVYTLAQELAPDIRINALLPGAIETPMTLNLNEDYKKQIGGDTPLGWGSMDDVVNYVEFLLSDKSKWITGQTLFVDGGRNTK